MTFSTALQTNGTGWLVAAMLALQIALPYFLRRIYEQKTSSKASVKSLPPSHQTTVTGTSMRWHYALGFVLPAAALAHAWIPMSSAHMPRTNMTGLWLATYALGLLFLQVLLGLTLQRSSNGSVRLGLRRVHFFAMLAVAMLALAHIWIN